MNKILHPAATRGSANYGWLKANYSFSFANYFDSNRTNFGVLRVFNDDYVAPAMGFGKHPHRNMEIVTIPQTGALKHKDSMGHSEVIHSGEIQVMSAGSGVEHSEVNASTTEPVTLFQIWIIPEKEEVAPRYDQKKIKPLLKQNALSTVVKPRNEAKDGELWIHQQAYFNMGEFTKETTLEYSLNQKEHGAYIFVINGTVVVDNETLNKKHAIGVWETDTIAITAQKDSTILLIEVPMNLN